jgi:hypothetical protein
MTCFFLKILVKLYVFNFQGFINLCIYSFLLYYIESYKLGINVITYICGISKVFSISKNSDIIINEDSDVSEERSKVRNHMTEVNSLRQKIIALVFILN